ncbi:hypothetical protein K488DRAFT_85650 [Vararia minispora EC-137]|uniref:Uncharacterized protein n=1 Tax=Vararia minispora EC-137 TaxID=1314806 RepID=A0ACB8QLW8_9AGAM|nr:hypothetical protein K488DRAFT_85650 [Vararia minispora EC-137]
MPSFYHPIDRRNLSISTVASLVFGDEDDDEDEDIRPDVESEYMLIPSPDSTLPSPRSSVIPLIYHQLPELSSWASHLTPEYEEEDDHLHEPEPEPRLLDASGTIFTRRGIENLGGLIFTLTAMVCIMIVPAVVRFSSVHFSQAWTDRMYAPGWISGPGIYPVNAS